MGAERLVVADSGPLIALAILDQLPLLNELFSQVVVPGAVVVECTAKPFSSGAAQIASAVDDERLIEVSVTASEQLESLARILDPGEAEALVLAEQKDSILLIDERKGRKIASQRGVKIVGTGAVLVTGKRKGVIDEVGPLLEMLQCRGYRLSNPLCQHLLELADEDPRFN